MVRTKFPHPQPLRMLCPPDLRLPSPTAVTPACNRTLPIPAWILSLVLSPNDTKLLPISQPLTCAATHAGKPAIAQQPGTIPRIGLICCQGRGLTRSHLLSRKSRCLWRAVVRRCRSRCRHRVPCGSLASSTCTLRPGSDLLVNETQTRHQCADAAPGAGTACLADLLRLAPAGWVTGSDQLLLNKLGVTGRDPALRHG